MGWLDADEKYPVIYADPPWQNWQQKTVRYSFG